MMFPRVVVPAIAAAEWSPEKVLVLFQTVF
jgi:hypothetical protein